MAVTLPVVNGSSGTWGTILNAALTDMDTRLAAATTTNGVQDTDVAALKNRVSTLETGGGSSGGKFTIATSSNRPPLTIGQIVLETDTGFLYYGASVNGTATRVPFPGSYLLKARQTGNLSFGNSQSTVVSWNSIDYDRLSALGATRFTAPVPGIYEFSGAVSFSANATGYRGTFWYLNGALYNASTISIASAGGTAPTVCAFRTVAFKLAAGEYVEGYAIQNSGGALAVDNTTHYQTGMQVKYLGYNV